MLFLDKSTWLYCNIKTIYLRTEDLEIAKSEENHKFKCKKYQMAFDSKIMLKSILKIIAIYKYDKNIGI